ncbi:MAG: polysaccharide deacetylase family protein [Bacillota bacterium]
MHLLFFSWKQIGRIGLVLIAALVLVLSSYTVVQKTLSVPTMKAEPIYQGNIQNKSMALTFNVDWGEQFIPDILNTLADSQVKATFFITGRWAEKNPELAQNIAKAGHELGNHGYSHPHPDRLNKAQNQEEIRRTEEALLEATGKKTTLFASPYGEHEPHVVMAADELGYQTIMWTIDTIDWQVDRSAQVIADKVLTKAQNGAIVLMHPTDRSTAALPRILSGLQGQGYKLVTVTEIIYGDG